MPSAEQVERGLNQFLSFLGYGVALVEFLEQFLLVIPKVFMVTIIVTFMVLAMATSLTQAIMVVLLIIIVVAVTIIVAALVSIASVEPLLRPIISSSSTSALPSSPSSS